MSKFQIDQFYEKVWEREISELKTKCTFYRHKKTQAEVLVLENDDNNKGFGVGFRTIPDDSTGLAHILEHTVLGGSRKYRVKEPFLHLVKSSLQTFLNAMTSDAKTIYPVATQNEKDLHNLMDVYLDAVFFPNIEENSFKQEGWHYDLDKDGNFIYKGVVYNEMKGYSAQSNFLLYHNSLRSLFPDTNYIHDSGGNPNYIPDLTYQQFVDFYKKHYHPTNAKVYMYGNADVTKLLEHLEEYLSQFELGTKVRLLEPQKPFEEPVRKSLPYSTKNLEEGNFLTFTWALNGLIFPREVLALHVIQYALEESAASTLRKKVLNKELAQSFYSFGMIEELLQPMFSLGYKGVSDENLKKVEEITYEVLKELSQNIDKDLLESAFNQVDFALRELKGGRYPRALTIFDKTLDSWAHDRDPLETVDIYKELDWLRKEVQSKNKYFESLIKKYLVDNNHHSVLTHYPDPEFIEKMEKFEKERLIKEIDAMSDEQKEKLKLEIKDFEEWTKREDDPKEVEKLPKLEVSDLDREIVKIPSEFENYNNVEVMKHDLATSGIVYLNLAFDFSNIKEEEIPYLTLLAELYPKLGTKNYSSDEISILADKMIGSYSVDLLIANKFGAKEEIVKKFVLNFDFLENNFESVNHIFKEKALNLDFSDKELVLSTFKEMLVGISESFKGNSGSTHAINRARAHLEKSYLLMDKTEGIDFYFFLKDLLEKFESNWESIKTTLEGLNKKLINRNSLIVNITCDESIYKNQKNKLVALIDNVPAFDINKENWDLKSKDNSEGFIIPSEVNSVGYAMDLNDTHYELNGAYHCVRKLLNSEYLWQKVRVEGGAYGAVSVFNVSNKIFSFVSYSDPNISNTISIYESVSDYLKSLKISRSGLDNLILGAIGALDNIIEPDDKGWFAFESYLTGITDEFRQKIRNDILNLTYEDILMFAQAIGQSKVKATTVIGSKDKIVQANIELKDKIEIKTLL